MRREEVVEVLEVDLCFVLPVVGRDRTLNLAAYKSAHGVLRSSVGVERRGHKVDTVACETAAWDSAGRLVPGKCIPESLKGVRSSHEDARVVRADTILRNIVHLTNEVDLAQESSVRLWTTNLVDPNWDVELIVRCD